MTKPVVTLVALLLVGAMACSGCAKSSKVEPTASPLGSVPGAPAGDATTTAPAGSSGPAASTAPKPEPSFVGKGAAFCTAIKDLVSGVQTDLTQVKSSADNMHRQADAIRANAPAEIKESADAYAKVIDQAADALAAATDESATEAAVQPLLAAGSAPDTKAALTWTINNCTIG